jgi:hypothetical protein
MISDPRFHCGSHAQAGMHTAKVVVSKMQRFHKISPSSIARRQGVLAGWSDKLLKVNQQANGGEVFAQPAGDIDPGLLLVQRSASDRTFCQNAGEESFSC